MYAPAARSARGTFVVADPLANDRVWRYLTESTLLHLEHRRVAEGETRVGIMAGWHAHLDLLLDVLSGRPVRDFRSHHMPLEDVYRRRLAPV